MKGFPSVFPSDFFIKRRRLRREVFRDPLKLDTHFWGQVLEGSNVAELGDHQKKKLFLNNAVKSLIPFRENHEGLL